MPYRAESFLGGAGGLGEYSFTELQFDIKIEKDEVYCGTKPHGAEFQTITGKLQAAKHTCNVFHV